jgi:hypothetical protein
MSFISPTFNLIKLRGGLVAFLLGTVIGVTVISASWYIIHQNSSVADLSEENITECIKKYFGTSLLTIDNSVLATEADLICYSARRHEYLLKDFLIRRNAYAVQPFETKVIMWMVVALVFGGVYLAWMQLRSSYELALLGKKESLDDKVSGVTIAGMSVKSSVVGVIILAISFAFFGVYVRYVYTIDDASALLPQDSHSMTTRGHSDSKSDSGKSDTGHPDSKSDTGPNGIGPPVNSKTD